MSSLVSPDDGLALARKVASVTLGAVERRVIAVAEEPIGPRTRRVTGASWATCVEPACIAPRLSSNSSAVPIRARLSTPKMADEWRTPALSHCVICESRGKMNKT